jgi:hypothetical protein
MSAERVGRLALELQLFTEYGQPGFHHPPGLKLTGHGDFSLPLFTRATLCQEAACFLRLDKRSLFPQIKFTKRRRQGGRIDRQRAQLEGMIKTPRHSLLHASARDFQPAREQFDRESWAPHALHGLEPATAVVDEGAVPRRASRQTTART